MCHEKKPNDEPNLGHTQIIDPRFARDCGDIFYTFYFSKYVILNITRYSVSSQLLLGHLPIRLLPASGHTPK